MNKCVMQAAPLVLKSLDRQIRELGGAGYNCGVQVEPLVGSYVCRYTFATPTGEMTLETANMLTVGMVQGNHIVHNGDTGEFLLITVTRLHRNSPDIHHTEKVLGTTYGEMMWALLSMFPERDWVLNVPVTLRMSQTKVIAKAYH